MGADSAALLATLEAEPRAVYTCAECDEEQLVYAGEPPEDHVCPACTRQRQAYRSPEQRLRAMGVPRRIARQATSDFDPQVVPAQIREDLQDWPPPAEDEEPMLLLYGGTGPGKTVLAARLLFRAAERAAQRGTPFAGAYVTTPGLMHELRESYGGERGGGVLRRYLRTGVLVLDELGGEQGTPHQLAVLGQLIDERWANAAPTVVISNFPPQRPKDHRGREIESAPALIDYDARLVSRVLSGRVVEMAGDDLRLGGR